MRVNRELGLLDITESSTGTALDNLMALIQEVKGVNKEDDTAVNWGKEVGGGGQ